MSTPRRVKSQGTRKKIFDAAASLLKDQGEESLTIANICEKAGVSKGTFFYHFNSKDDLMLYYMQEAFDDFMADRVDSDAHNDDVYAVVLDLYRGYLGYCENAGIDFISSYYTPKNKALDARVFMGTEETMNILLRTCVKEITRAQENGLIRTDWSASDISFDCCSVIKGCIFEWCVTNGAVDLQAHSEHMLHVYFQSLVTDAYRKRFPHPEPPMA